MKGARNENTKQSKQMHGNKPLPEIRDDLDSRNNEEINDKPTGHNKKNTKADKQKKH